MSNPGGRTQNPSHQISLTRSRDAGRPHSVMFGRCPFRGSRGQADPEHSFEPIVSIQVLLGEGFVEIGITVSFG